MTNSAPLVSAPAAPLPGESLWEKAPGWRNLVTAASLFTVLALVTPVLMPPQDAGPIPAAVPRRAAPPMAPAPAAPRILPQQPLAVPVHHPVHVATARVAPQPIAPSCSINMPTAPRHLGTAVVVGIIPHDQSLQIFQTNGQRFGGPVNPAYVDDVRLLIHPDGAPEGMTRGTVVPAGLLVAVGDRITVDAAYRDPSRSCAWVPTLVTGDLGPAAPKTLPAPAVTLP